jgi:hypothetical protein
MKNIMKIQKVIKKLSKLRYINVSAARKFLTGSNCLPAHFDKNCAIFFVKGTVYLTKLCLPFYLRHPLTFWEKLEMEGNISVEEITIFFKKCKNNVAPGTSGFTFDFYKFFWRNLKHFIIRAVNFAFENNLHSPKV